MAGNIGSDDLGRDLAEGDAVAAETHHGEDVRQAGNAADERQAGAGGAEGGSPDMVRLRKGKAEQGFDLAVDRLRLLPKLLRRGIGVLALLVLAARDQPAVAGAAQVEIRIGALPDDAVLQPVGQRCAGRRRERPGGDDGVIPVGDPSRNS